MTAQCWICRTNGVDMSKPLKKVEKGVRRGLRSFDRQVGFTKQKEILSSGAKAIMGVPKIEQAKPAEPIRGSVIRPIAATGSTSESQSAATKDLYRRRRARGVATSPAGLTGEASVRRKRLLGG